MRSASVTTWWPCTSKWGGRYEEPEVLSGSSRAAGRDRFYCPMIMTLFAGEMTSPQTVIWNVPGP